MPAVARPAHRRHAGGRGTRSARRHDTQVRSVRAQPRARGPAGLMPLAATVVEELRRIVGRESVIDSANDLRIFERDASIEGALPDAVVLASTTAEVAGVI